MIEIIYIWEKFKNKRFGKFMAASIIGGIVLVSWHHLFGINDSKNIKYYLVSFAIGGLMGVMAGLIAALLNICEIIRIVCLRRNGLIRVLPNFAFGLVVCICLILIMVACVALLFYSDYVYGLRLFNFTKVK